jgi:hypothetical protein
MQHQRKRYPVQNKKKNIFYSRNAESVQKKRRGRKFKERVRPFKVRRDDIEIECKTMQGKRCITSKENIRLICLLASQNNCKPRLIVYGSG